MYSEIIRDWDTFDALESEWDALLLRSRAPSIFLTWAWISAWRSAISDAVPPYAVIVRESSGTLAGVAPLYLASMRFLRIARYRMLRFMADTATGSEYPDWIVDKAIEEDVLVAICEALKRDSENWDTLWLPKVAGWTGAKDRLLNRCSRSEFRHRSRTEVFSQLQLGQSLEQFEKSLSANRRQQWRRVTRRIHAIDGLEFDVCDSQQALPEFLDSLFDLHWRRWRAVGQEGTFRRKPAEERFYRNFAPVALQRGWLALYGLRHHGRLVAVQYGYVFDGVYSQLQEGFDPEFAAGAGNVLRYRIIGRLIDDGVRTYDFLGGWSEHKRRWGAEARDGYEIFIGARKWRTLPLFFRDVWPRGRFIELRGQKTG